MSDYDSPEDLAFFAAMARATWTWSGVELQLDGLIYKLFVLHDRRPKKRKLPVLLSEKVKYLRDAHAEGSISGKHAFLVPQLLDLVEAEAPNRNDIVHGSIVKHVEGSGEATLLRLEHDGTGHWAERRIVVSTTSLKETERRFTTILAVANAASDLVPGTLPDTSQSQG